MLTAWKTHTHTHTSCKRERKNTLITCNDSFALFSSHHVAPLYVNIRIFVALFLSKSAATCSCRLWCKIVDVAALAFSSSSVFLLYCNFCLVTNLLRYSQLHWDFECGVQAQWFFFFFSLSFGFVDTILELWCIYHINVIRFLFCSFLLYNSSLCTLQFIFRLLKISRMQQKTTKKETDMQTHFSIHLFI